MSAEPAGEIAAMRIRLREQGRARRRGDARMRAHRRARAAASLLALVAAAWLAPAAAAEPAEVQVRVVGGSQTLFEGPVLTEGHDIEASTDTEERSCDGVDPVSPEKNTTPGPTPTAAAVDAMTILGEGFGGVWYASYDDYLITRWGPESSESWGVFVNDTLLDVGGCQYELHEGAEVLWSAGSMSRPLLAMFAQGSNADSAPLTAQAELGVPFTVEVVSYKPASGKPPPTPERTGSTAYQGAAIVPVETSANGFETPLAEASESVETNSDGQASVTFTTSGWHRIMAIAPGTVRSNRLDVCVPEPGAEGCGTPPAEDCPRTPPSAQAPAVQRAREPAGCGAEQPSSTKTQTASGETAAKTVQEGGQTRPPTSGGSKTGTREIRIDGLTLVPWAARSPALHYRGRWRRRAERGALDGTVMLGAAGASLTTTLASGRPAFILRDVRNAARVEVRAGRHRARYTVRGSHSEASRLLLAARRARAGAVTLRVIAGTVGIDGVAVTP